MSKRYNIMITIVLILTLFCAGCGGGKVRQETKEASKSAEESTGGSKEEGLKEGSLVAIIPSDMSDPNLVYVSKCLEKYCDEMGYESALFDPQANAQTQANMISNAVAQGASAVVFDPIDSAALGTAMMEAKEAGVLVITTVGDIDEMYHEYRDVYVGPDDLVAGEMAAECFKEHFPDGAEVVCIEGAAGHSAQIRRRDGFAAGIEGGNIKILDSKSCTSWSTSDAMTIAEDFIVMHGDKMDGIFCHWDNGGVGVVEALEAAKYEPGDVFMVTIDGCYNGFDLIREGWVYASIMQDCNTMARVCIESIKTLQEGGEVEEIIHPDLILVTEENVDSIDPGW
ncbi:sugar ABC transporter substrate-binding protein [Lacrimispora sp. NSJ-141]|uniref:Sugar ABC transporter substrate-binding protein n=1 Tax=Lientehia hominis TaxID=2897778 RepID=A0AAP2RIW4_9FIRM|nr:sugar ABC transporter substrate-binding protein [Lientehia hominis]MCD2493034.1 sugar ABC transporter substrate-binding protein [Lientehia hominis]